MRRPIAKLALLAYFFLLTASFPVKEGVEVGARAGGGTYETEQNESGSCGRGRWKSRTQHVDNGLFVRGWAPGEKWYISAEVLGGRHNDIEIVELESEGITLGPFEQKDSLGGQAYARFGYQWEKFAFEAGPGVLIIPAFGLPFPVPVPSVAARFGPEKGWYGYMGILDEPWPLYNPLHLGAGYSGEGIRGRISLDGSGDVDFRLLENVWFGGGAGIIWTGTYFGPHIAANGRLTVRFGAPDKKDQPEAP